jgi:photosystem II stability/assembly factor-like uncharacterized protein
MTIPHRVYVGTIGEGIFRSLDGGETFRRASDGMFIECRVRALAVHPDQPNILFLGSEEGVFVSKDGADNWTRLPAPTNGLEVWSLHVAPLRPELLLAGTSPSGILRSVDSGQSWTQAATTMVRDCPRIRHTRVTCIIQDSHDADRLWAGVEIDGIHRSVDGGRTWQPLGSGLSSRDIHSLALVPSTNGSRLLAGTNNGLNRSDDGGETWRLVDMSKVLPWPYCRALAQLPGRPNEILLGNGDGPPGSSGAIGLSTDGSSTWKAAAMPGRANSTVWSFATHPADPKLVYASSVSGELYRSSDQGHSWEKLAREFGEIRALAWTPGLA